MTGHLPVFDAVEHARFAAAREWRTVEEHVTDVLRHRKTPATMPATMAAATAAAPQQEEPMSLATLETDLGQRIGAFEAVVRTEFGKLAADLPGITAEAKQLAANPFAQVALKAAEHLASGILPLNAIATVAGHALQELDDLAALYGPPQQAGPPAQPQQAPAQ